jgi:hypothetical protein
MESLKSRVKKKITSLIKKHLLPILLPLCLVGSILTVYQLSDKVIHISGICKKTDKDIVLKGNIVILKSIDTVNRSINIRTMSALKTTVNCSLKNVEVKSFIYSVLKLSDLIPEKNYLLVDKKEEIEKELLKLREKSGSYISLTGKCEDKSYKENVFLLNNSKIRDSQIYLELINPDKETIFCEFTQETTYNVVSLEYYINYKIENSFSLEKDEVVFSSSFCEMDDKKFKNL